MDRRPGEACRLEPKIISPGKTTSDTSIPAITGKKFVTFIITDRKCLLLALKINAGLCIDSQRIFSTGFSFGGMMSYTLPYEFDVFRAVAPCSGKTGIIPYNAKYTRPIPILAFHGDKDTVAQTALGKEFFGMYRVDRNHCGAETKAFDPSPCVQYQNCDEPSIWCEFSGAHEVWSPEPQAIWKFFSQF